MARSAPSRSCPNAEKLLDGAIQRAAVQPNRYDLHYKSNVDKVGVYKREENNVRSSLSAVRSSYIHDGALMKGKIARIYHPDRKHVHDTPLNK